MSQHTIVLKNAHVLTGGAQSSDPSHHCSDGICTYVSACGWLKRWRGERVEEKPAAAPAPLVLELPR